MPIASYQGKVFQGMYTIDGLGWGGALDTEAQEKLQDKPSTYIKGKTLSTISFDIPLRAELGHNVRAEIEAWEAIRDTARPDYFILGEKPLGRNKWLLKSTTVSDPLLDAQGWLIKAVLKLELEEYVRAGSAEASASKKAAAGVAIGLEPSPSIYSPPDKAEQKRANPNVSAAT
uniref:phage tail protein n=1 Tax=Gorillibacterium sp. sgz5001074 TaxID=3446695 RepID=UPI003F6610FE